LATATNSASNGSAPGPRRTGLQQARSRQTRQKLVRAALQLWTDRGFDTGVDSTTVEEIVQAAGVTKGTFYFHFAHKEDILLEIGWGTSEAMIREANAALARDLPVETVLDDLFASLARRVSSTPRVAVARTLLEFHRSRDLVAPMAEEHGGYRAAYELVFTVARDRGVVPDDVDVVDLAEMLQSLTMDAIHRWIHDDIDIAAALSYRARVLLAGVREVPARR